MQAQITIRPANPGDYDRVTNLLQSEELPISDLDKELPHFFVAANNSAIVAAIGLEHYGETALLRSMVTAKAWRNKALAAQLVQTLLHYAQSNGVRSVYLITTTAEKYFERKGFIKTDRAAVRGSVMQSKEFNGLCPDTAVVMVRTL